MKKTRILVSSLLAAVMLVGAGYAAWTDKLTINSTVSTGELRVEFAADNNFPKLESYYQTLNKESVPTGQWNKNNTYVTTEKPTQSGDNKVLTVKIGNMYPGAQAKLQARIQNKGTISAVIDSVGVDFNKKTELSIEDKYWNNDETKAKINVMCGVTYFAKKSDGSYQVEASKGRLLREHTTVATIDKNFTKMLSGLQIEPNDYITLDIPDSLKVDFAKYAGYEDAPGNCIDFYLPADAGNEFQKQNLSFNIVLNFKQQNQ